MDIIESRDDRERREMLERIDLINSLRGLDALDITGYIYRTNPLRRTEKTTLPPIYDIFSDDEIGLMYGPGFYTVVYHLKLSSGAKEVKTTTYNIGREYLKRHKDYALQNGEPFYGSEVEQHKNGFSDLLNKGNLESIVGLLGALKMVFGANQAPQQDQFEMIRNIIQPQMSLLERFISQKQQNIPDTLVTEAFKSLQNRKEEKQPNLLEQLELFERFKNATNSNQSNYNHVESEPEMSPLEKMLDKAMQFLPQFLEMHGGNVAAAAADVKKKKPFEVSLLKSNAKLQQTFFNELVKKHGINAAQQWAAGFGLNAAALTKNVEILQPKREVNNQVNRGMFEL